MGCANDLDRACHDDNGLTVCPFGTRESVDVHGPGSCQLHHWDQNLDLNWEGGHKRYVCSSDGPPGVWHVNGGTVECHATCGDGLANQCKPHYTAHAKRYLCPEGANVVKDDRCPFYHNMDHTAQIATGNFKFICTAGGNGRWVTRGTGKQARIVCEPVERKAPPLTVAHVGVIVVGVLLLVGVLYALRRVTPGRA